MEWFPGLRGFDASQGKRVVARCEIRGSFEGMTPMQRYLPVLSRGYEYLCLECGKTYLDPAHWCAARADRYSQDFRARGEKALDEAWDRANSPN